jgi:hypothetical protein
LQHTPSTHAPEVQALLSEHVAPSLNLGFIAGGVDVDAGGAVVGSAGL